MTVVPNMLSVSDSQKGQHDTGQSSILFTDKFTYMNTYLTYKDI